MQSKGNSGANIASPTVLEAQRRRVQEKVVSKLLADCKAMNDLFNVLSKQLEGVSGVDAEAAGRRVVSKISNDNKERFVRIRTAIQEGEFYDITVEDLSIAALTIAANKGLTPKSSQVNQLNTVKGLKTAIAAKLFEFEDEFDDNKQAIIFLYNSREIMQRKELTKEDLEILGKQIDAWTELAEELQAELAQVTTAVPAVEPMRFNY